MASSGVELHELLDRTASSTSDSVGPTHPTDESQSLNTSRPRHAASGNSDYSFDDDDNESPRASSQPQREEDESDENRNAKSADAYVSSAAENKHNDNDDNDAPTVRRRAKKYLAVMSWWIPELVASACSVVSFAAIVIVLKVYNRHAVDRLNLPSGLTLNGIIALLATLGRACLCAPVCSGILQEMWLYLARESRRSCPKSRLRDLELFTNASYGTVGGLRFLAHMQASKLVAGLGCLIMIVSLVFSTFTQQLVVYEVLVPIDAVPLGNIPRSERWDPEEDVFDLQSDYSTPTFRSIASFYNGAMADSVAPMSPECPSGDCTWPVTPTLAVCGQCEKPQYSVIDCYNPMKLRQLEDAGCDDDPELEVCQEDVFCNYSLPSGAQMSMYNSAKYDLSTGSEVSYYLREPAWTFHSNSTASEALVTNTNGKWEVIPDERDYLMILDLFGLPYNARVSAKEAGSTIVDPQYHQCALWMCIQSRSTRVESGQHYQDIVAVEDMHSSIMKSETLVFDLDHDQQPNFTSYTSSLSLSNILGGSVTLFIDGDSSDVDQYMLHAIWNGTVNADAWINNLATSITNSILLTNHTHRDEFNGTQFELAVRVRWLWIILPGLLVLSSILFMVTVMIRTVRSPVRSWKGSPLTMLLFDLDMEVRDAASDRVDDYRGVEKAVGGQTVRLVRRDDGRRAFVAA